MVIEKAGKQPMKTISYDIISLSRKTLVLNKCLHCQAELLVNELEHSDDAKTFIDNTDNPEVSTLGVQCPDCGWWAVRERCLDKDMYDPPVADIIIMDASDPGGSKAIKGAAPWDNVIADKAHWDRAEVIPSKDAVLLFGTAQMLLPNPGTFSRDAMLDKLKSLAPILFPIIVILLFALFY